MALKDWKHTSPNEWYNKEDNLKIDIRHFSNGYWAWITNLNTHTSEGIVDYHTGQTREEVFKKVIEYIKEH
jgi:hypothetical protein